MNSMPSTCPGSLEREWTITIGTPSGGVPALVEGLGRELPLTQGPHDNVTFLRENCRQRFRALEGSHSGAEGTIQETPAQQIVISIPPDRVLLSKVFEVIFAVHVNEEPTIRFEEVWGSRSKMLNDKDKPNRYWNRPNAASLHGLSVG